MFKKSQSILSREPAYSEQSCIYILKRARFYRPPYHSYPLHPPQLFLPHQHSAVGGGVKRERKARLATLKIMSAIVYEFVMCVSLSIRFEISRSWAHDLGSVSGILKTSQCRTDFESRGSNLVQNQRVGTGRFRDTIFSGWVPARRLDLVCN